MKSGCEGKIGISGEKNFRVMEIKDITVGILAGGRSSRMGTNKALLKKEGQTFIERLVSEFAQGGQIIISQAEKGDYEALFADKNIVFASDENEGIGPIEGLRQILKKARREYAFVCAVDMPYLRAEMAEFLTGYISSDYDCYVVRDRERIHPLCAIYSVAALQVIEDRIREKDYRLRYVLDRLRTKYVSLEYTVFGEKQLDNINTPDEFAGMDMAVSDSLGIAGSKRVMAAEIAKERAGRRLVFAVSGTKNSGKTHLVNKLIKCFVGDGYRVGVIKHDGHGYSMDHEGTDTDSFMKSGALYSAIYSAKSCSLNARLSVDAQILMRACPDCEVLICEGMKDLEIPKLVTIRGEAAEEYFYAEPVIACISDGSSQAEALGEKFRDCPHFHSRDIAGIYEYVKKWGGVMES